MITPITNRRNPAAPELLGSKGAGGAEHSDWQTDNLDDRSAYGLNQLLLAWWIIRHFDLISPRGIMEHTTAPPFRNGTASAATDLRFARILDKLYPLGPRIFALIVGLLRETSFCMTKIEALVVHFADQDPETLRVLGADLRPAHPDLRVVGHEP